MRQEECVWHSLSLLLPEECCHTNGGNIYCSSSFSMFMPLTVPSLPLMSNIEISYLPSHDMPLDITAHPSCYPREPPTSVRGVLGWQQAGGSGGSQPSRRRGGAVVRAARHGGVNRRTHLCSRRARGGGRGGAGSRDRTSTCLNSRLPPTTSTRPPHHMRNIGHPSTTNTNHARRAQVWW